MSDRFEMLADVDVGRHDALALSRAVVAQLREKELITGRLSAACVLGGKGYRPGPAVAKLYTLARRESEFWTLQTCGVEPQVGRHFNFWALGPVCEGLTCPSCAATIKSVDDNGFGDALGIAIKQWSSETGTAALQCPRCRKKSVVFRWECKPPLGFCNMSFRFWNWPPLGLSSWKIDIVALVRQITSHNIVHTYGRL